MLGYFDPLLGASSGLVATYGMTKHSQEHTQSLSEAFAGRRGTLLASICGSFQPEDLRTAAQKPALLN